MKTRTIISIAISLIAMVLIPVLTVISALGADALGLMLLYTIILNPVVSIVIGILSGWGEKAQWYLPIANAAIYLIASIAIMGFDVSLLIGTVAYIVIGALSAYITNAIKKHGNAK